MQKKGRFKAKIHLTNEAALMGGSYSFLYNERV
jgi:hypothetical protein